MTKDEKELLIKDLCARLPYGVKCTTKSTAWTGVYNVVGYINNRIYLDNLPYYDGDDEWLVESIVPYLRPMSSMTNNERLEYFNLTKREILDGGYVTDNSVVDVDNVDEFTDWLNAHHFDYRGLIEKGLALEAPEGMYS